MDMVNVISPNGEPLSIESSRLNQALQEGYSIPSPEQVQSQLKEQSNQQHYGEQGAGKAFLESAARAPSFGTSDIALTKSGLAEPEALRERQKRHPIASAAGTIAGIASAMAVGDELPLLNAVKGISRAGEAVSEGVASLAPAGSSLAKQVLARVGGKAVGSALEGAAYGAGQVVSEHALGDPDLNSQKALAEIGIGALLGGGLGGALGLAAEGVPAAVNSAQNFFKKGSNLLETSAMKGYAKAAAAVSGKSVDDILEAAKLSRGALSEGQTSELGQELNGSLAQQHDAVNKAIKETYGTIRKQETEKLLDDTYLPTAQKAVDDTKNKLLATLETINDRPAIYPARYADALEGIYNDFDKGLNRDSAAGIFNKIDELKGNLDKKIKYGKFPTPGDEDAQRLISQLRTDLKDTLENENTFGVAASRQAAFNDAFHQFQSQVDRQGAFNKAFMTKSVTKGGKAAYVIDPKKVERAMRDPLKIDALDAYQSASKNLLDQIEASYKSLPQKEFDRGSIEQLLNKNQDLQAKLASDAAFKHMQAKLAGGDSLAEGVLGFEAIKYFGLLGAGLAVGARALKNPGPTIQKLAAVERLMNRASQKLESMSKAVFNPSSKAFKTTEALSIGELNKIREQTQGAASQPQTLVDKLEGATRGLADFAPSTVLFLHNNTANAINFLSSKLPQSAMNAPLDPKAPTSPFEVARFNQYYQTVKNPYRALAQVKDGTLTSESLESLMVVYPKLYQEMKQNLMQNLSMQVHKGKHVPYQTKMMLSMFLGQDMESSLTSNSILGNQLALQPITRQQQAKEEGSTLGGLQQLSLGESALTPMQSAVNRED